MKKIIAILLLVVMVLSLAACGKKKISLHCDGCGKEVTTTANMDESWTIFCKDCEPSIDLD